MSFSFCIFINALINKQYVAVYVTQYNSSLSKFVPNFRILSQVVAEKSFTEKSKNVHWRKKNEQIKGLTSNMWLFFHTIQLITIKLCTKFQNPKSSSC